MDSQLKEQAEKEQKIFLILTKDIIIPRIKTDIEYIVNKGWGELSLRDFFHAHLCIPFDNNCDVRNKIENAILLYHTKEYTGITTDRNVVSYVNSDKIYLDNSKFRVTPKDLRAYQPLTIEFRKEDSDGLKFDIKFCK